MIWKGWRWGRGVDKHVYDGLDGIRGLCGGGIKFNASNDDNF